MSRTQWSVITEHLREEIVSGRLGSGVRLPAEIEIAAQYKVSRPTANRAIQELKRLGYVARRPGSGTVVLPQGRSLTGQVAILINTFGGHPQVDHIRGIQESLPDDYHMLLWDTREDAELEARYLRRASEHVDVIFCWPTCHPENTALLQEAAESPTPLILLDCMPPGVDAAAFMTDNRGSTEQAVHFLQSRGHRRIAYFGENNRPILSTQERYQGFLAAALAGGDPSPEQRARFFNTGMDWHVWMRDALVSLRQGPEPVTAIVCEQDGPLTTLLRLCDDLGIRIPEDLEIAAFADDLPQDDRIGQRVHRIIQRGKEIGKLAAQHALSRLAESTTEATRSAHTVVHVPSDFYPASVFS